MRCGKSATRIGRRVRYGRCDIVLFPGLRDFHGTGWDIGDDVRLHAPFAPLHVPHYKNPPENRQLWDIAADMAAEALIQSFEMDSFRHCREEEQREALTQVRRETEGLSAERIYRWLASGNRKLEEVHQLEDLFRVDDHGLWYPENSNFLKPEDVQDSEESKDENPTELLRETDVPDWDRIAQMVKSLWRRKTGVRSGENSSPPQRANGKAHGLQHLSPEVHPVSGEPEGG